VTPPGDESPRPDLPDLPDLPVHHRTIDLEVYERDGTFEVVGRLEDRRPWADGEEAVREVHDMTLQVTVRRADLQIVAARADMRRFPHGECPEIESHFSHLVGLNVGRGYTRAVQERFGRALGCTHLEFLARAVGPVVIQAIPSSAVRAAVATPGADTAANPGLDFLVDTCHVWRADGPGQEKIAAGWRPGRGEYPAPTAVEVRRRRDAEAGAGG
jgi:hypothetical protein